MRYGRLQYFALAEGREEAGLSLLVPTMGGAGTTCLSYKFSNRFLLSQPQ